MKRSLCSILALGVLAAAPAMATDLARYVLPPGNFGGVPFTVNSTDQLPLYSGLTPAARQHHARPTSTTSTFPRTSRRSSRRTRKSTGRPGLQPRLRRVRHPARLWADPGGRRVRGRMDHGARPRAPDPDRPRPGARRRRRRAQHRRLLAGHQRPGVHAERGGRGPGDAAGAAPGRRVRREGPGDPRATPRPTPTASTPTGRRTTSTRRPRPSTTSSRSRHSSGRSSAPAAAARRRTPTCSPSSSSRSAPTGATRHGST